MMETSNLKEFGPEHAVFNLSKLGIRYFRLSVNAGDNSKNKLIEYFTSHPNVGWIYTASGVFNLGIGIWVKTNTEINDIAFQIRNILSKEDEIIFQSELTSLYGFNYLDEMRKSFCIIDSSVEKQDISVLEQDYIKLLAIDSSLSDPEMSKVLNTTENEVLRMKKDLKEKEVIVSYKKRINFEHKYYKVLIDTTSKIFIDSFERLEKLLWHSKVCIYIAKANSKYNYEFEIVLEYEKDLDEYLQFFTDFKVAVLEENLYTNLYPDNKITNFNLIKNMLLEQTGKEVIDLRNSKIWYLNHEGAKAYINIYENKKYFEEMNKDEVSLFPEIADYIKLKSPNTKFNIIDIGSGNGMKGRLFIESLGEENTKAYYPIDLQTLELEAALNVHQDGAYAKHPVFFGFGKYRSSFSTKDYPK